MAWFLAVVGGTTLLGVAFAYAVAQWRHRDRRLDPIREAATVRNYAEEERAEETGQRAATDVTPRSNAA